MNGNIVKKPNKDEVEYEEEEIELDEDDDEDDSSSRRLISKDLDPKKRLFLLMGVIVGAVLLLLLILFIASLFTSRSYEYEDIENILKNAAISYFADYPDSLPQNDGDVVEIDSSNLVYAGKMNDLSSYRNDGEPCTGKVQVEKVGGEYVYTPFLNCGSNYNSVPLATKVQNDNPVTSSGEGLYSYNGNYVFRGEQVNNWVQLEENLWRIVKITPEGNVVLIHSTGIEYSQPWDDRYNEEMAYEAGLNKYSVSRIKEYMEKIYVNPDEDMGEKILSDKDRSKIVAHTLCVGGRTATSQSKTNSEECRQKVQNQKLGLLTLSDYLYASLDSNCKSAETKSCMNYNYLVLGDDWWLMTPDSSTTCKVFKIGRDGSATVEWASSYSRVRPVIYLNSNVMSASGKGTETDPYTVK
ncbi:MAG: hypothetical protein IKF71_03080 [Bacilli bacterium]|nr:hypothetical protein [Bacilli bacterium]